jgi:hypothetical protein
MGDGRWEMRDAHFKTLTLILSSTIAKIVDDRMRIAAVLFLKTTIRVVAGGLSLYI